MRTPNVRSLVGLLLILGPTSWAHAMLDNFSSYTRNVCFLDGAAFGHWTSAFSGYGCVKVATDGASSWLEQRPAVSRSPLETHASLVLGPTSANPQTFSVRVKTVAQLRQGSPPNPWEVGWVIWHYEDNTHFYYFQAKPNGWELGKVDPAYPGGQRFLASGDAPAFPTGAWYAIKIIESAKGTISSYVNGKLINTFTDSERPYTSGKIGLYNEDAHVRFKDVALSVSGIQTAAGGSSSCLDSAGAWRSSAFAPQTGSFVATFAATPNTARMDGVMGLSNGPATKFSSLAAAVRFNAAGAIDARDGGAYTASSSIPYRSGISYRFRLVVNMPSRTYSAYVTPSGSSERLIGSDYAFRAEQAGLSSLSSLGVLAQSGSESVCDLALSAPASAPTVSAAAPDWGNTPFAPQAGTFEARFDATPSMAKMDGVIGLSNGPAKSFASLAAIVRFNNMGVIDARNGGAYAAASAVPYSPGTVYHFRLLVDTNEHTYSVYVTPHGSIERLLGARYVFRSEQATAASLDNLGSYADTGSATAVSLAVSPWRAPVAPIMSGVSAAGATSTGATIVWSTDQPADSQVKYGATTSYGSSSALASGAVTSHSVALAGLSAGTVYHYQALSRGMAGLLTASAGLSFTTQSLSSSGSRDRFGISQLFATAAEGMEWFSTWGNGAPRAFSGIDPYDPWFDSDHGNASYTVDGNGLLRISGPIPRMYIHDPAGLRSWRNVEMSVYAYRVSDQSTPWAGIVGVARSNHGTLGPELQNLCDSRGHGARFRYDGTIDFEKETSHPNSVRAQNKAFWPGGLPYNTWIGYKLVVYDLPNGDVKLENYMDLTDGVNGGTWVKVNELQDNGSNFGVGGVPCKAGIDPALRLTNSDDRPGSESGKPSTTVYWRSDDVGINGLIYKKMSVRGIDPANAIK